MKPPHAERNCIGFRETAFQKAKEEKEKKKKNERQKKKKQKTGEQIGIKERESGTRNTHKPPRPPTPLTASPDITDTCYFAHLYLSALKRLA